jgi:hypothetical protein
LIGEVFITITVSLQRTPQTFFLVLPIPEMKLMTGFRGTNLPTADLVMDEGFDEEQFFNPSGPAFNSHPTCQDVIPVKECTKIDMDDVLEERRLSSTPRNGTLKILDPISLVCLRKLRH